MARIPYALPLLFLTTLAVHAQRPELKGWEPTFTEEFNTKELEFPKWSLHDPWGHPRNRESQLWTPESVELANGSAKLIARKNAGYTSGIITTYGSFAQTYGRFEIRCKIPAGQGLLPKFWLLPIPSGEIPSIDILAVTGQQPTKALFSNTWGDEKTERSYSGSWDTADLSKDFHTFTLEWREDKLIWFIDGKERFRSTQGVPHQPMYLIASLAVGGTEAKWPDSSTPFPAAFEIDYIRVWRQAEPPPSR